MPSIATSTPPASLKIKPYSRPTGSKPSKPTSSSFKASSVLEVYPTIPYPEGLSRIAFRLPNNKSITPHQWKVYDYIRRIPEGRVSTYALIAKGIGCGSSQAVGGALRDNPFQPHIPCHRIISSTLFIGGFQGAWSGTKDGGDDGKVGRKWGLLKAEGVEFDARGYLEGGKEVLWSG